MNKADEMFEKLGYEKMKHDKNGILYKKDKISTTYFIAFDLKTKTICCEYSDEDYEINAAQSFTMQELQAINEKVKELGWNE